MRCCVWIVPSPSAVFQIELCTWIRILRVVCTIKVLQETYIAAISAHDTLNLSGNQLLYL